MKSQNRPLGPIAFLLQHKLALLALAGLVTIAAPRVLLYAFELQLKPIRAVERAAHPDDSSRSSDEDIVDPDSLEFILPVKRISLPFRHIRRGCDALGAALLLGSAGAAVYARRKRTGGGPARHALD